MASASINRSLLLPHRYLPFRSKTLTLIAPISIAAVYGKLALRRSGCKARVRVSASSSSSSLSSSSSTNDDLRPDIDENPEGIISGEWPENHSLLSFDDFRAYLETQIISKKMKPTVLLGDVMSTYIRAATADQTLEEIDHNFEFVSGLPVIDAEKRCIGVISRRDRDKAPNGEIVMIWKLLYKSLKNPILAARPGRVLLGKTWEGSVGLRLALMMKVARQQQDLAVSGGG